MNGVLHTQTVTLLLLLMYTVPDTNLLRYTQIQALNGQETNTSLTVERLPNNSIKITSSSPQEVFAFSQSLFEEPEAKNVFLNSKQFNDIGMEFSTFIDNIQAQFDGNCSFPLLLTRAEDEPFLSVDANSITIQADNFGIHQIDTLEEETSINFPNYKSSAVANNLVEQHINYDRITDKKLKVKFACLAYEDENNKLFQFQLSHQPKAVTSFKAVSPPDDNPPFKYGESVIVLPLSCVIHDFTDLFGETTLDFSLFNTASFGISFTTYDETGVNAATDFTLAYRELQEKITYKSLQVQMCNNNPSAEKSVNFVLISDKPPLRLLGMSVAVFSIVTIIVVIVLIIIVFFIAKRCFSKDIIIQEPIFDEKISLQIPETMTPPDILLDVDWKKKTEETVSGLSKDNPYFGSMKGFMSISRDKDDKEWNRIEKKLELEFLGDKYKTKPYLIDSLKRKKEVQQSKIISYNIMIDYKDVEKLVED